MNSLERCTGGSAPLFPVSQKQGRCLKTWDFIQIIFTSLKDLFYYIFTCGWCRSKSNVVQVLTPLQQTSAPPKNKFRLVADKFYVERIARYFVALKHESMETAFIFERIKTGEIYRVWAGDFDEHTLLPGKPVGLYRLLPGTMVPYKCLYVLSDTKVACSNLTAELLIGDQKIPLDLPSTILEDLKQSLGMQRNASLSGGKKIPVTLPVSIVKNL